MYVKEKEPSEMYDIDKEIESLSPSRNDSYSENEFQDDELDGYLRSTENHFIVPLLMNCKQENTDIISTSIPFEVQQNALLVIDMDTLVEREDILSDNNGEWKHNGCKTKFFVTTKDSDDRVIGLTRVSKEERGDIAVRRRYHRTTG
ncbi:Hypothetical predicted protein [Paramuricea clavata]|uniref:Uncharacterized protein n=1 Tax=Paramuricea clavata TaxID=317549 RepID=A0A6S7H088_PARCT|nr:Hypothetical predicted protein [Paramuricea clavata]